MAIDLKNGNGFEQLKSHIGHKVVVVGYGEVDDPISVAIECEDCNEVLLDINAGEDWGSIGEPS